jgi:phospholipid-binding lipoprotein MlaA
MTRLPTRLLLAVLVLVLTACAGTQSRNTDPERDPWEGFNRKIHAFNMGADKVFRPIAVGYDKIMPDPIQRGIGNFFRNLNYPVTAINQILQGKFDELGVSTERFIANTIFGLGGFVDIASMGGIPDLEEDFGQTMAVWGWEDSRYLVVPFFGPFTVRDTLGRAQYGYMHPVTWYSREHDVLWPYAVDLLQRRAALLPRDADILEAYDPYTFIRDAWLQNREYRIYDGDPPEQDYEALLEEYEDL